ncbi:hypothetical protein ACXHXG_16210 [Rhizobium sp. LEGMi198b]
MGSDFKKAVVCYGLEDAKLKIQDLLRIYDGSEPLNLQLKRADAYFILWIHDNYEEPSSPT